VCLGVKEELGQDLGDFKNRLNLQSDSGFSAKFPTRSKMASGSLLGLNIGPEGNHMGGKLSYGGRRGRAPRNCAQPHEDFDEQCLQAHNDYRATHGAEALEMASDLTAHAQAWADKLAKRTYLRTANACWKGERESGRTSR